jgi:histidinol dehydrogenase
MIEAYKLNESGGIEAATRLINRFQLVDDHYRAKVETILESVRGDGDEALVHFTRQFDAPEFTLDDLRVSDGEYDAAAEKVSDDFLETLSAATARIRSFHEREKEDSWLLTREDGAIVGRLVRPVDSAGLYVPGGTGGSTPLVSSVLMNGIPAKIAGVERCIMVTPPAPDNSINPYLLVAARHIGIDEVYKAGSAWAIGALAFGTKRIAAVDVIVGPGNQWVTEAKRQVAGKVRIDMIAGPSEVLIIADETANPEYIAADMIAQAEHDVLALAIVITTQSHHPAAINKALDSQLSGLGRADIARRSLRDRGCILVAADVGEAIGWANNIAVEHLELQVDDPWSWIPHIKHAGAIFCGNHTPEAAGDYFAGPNHVLPTMGTARYASALGVETFVKRSSLISYSPAALAGDAEHIIRMAELEGLDGHGASVKRRLS